MSEFMWEEEEEEKRNEKELVMKWTLGKTDEKVTRIV